MKISPSAGNRITLNIPVKGKSTSTEIIQLIQKENVRVVNNVVSVEQIEITLDLTSPEQGDELIATISDEFDISNIKKRDLVFELHTGGIVALNPKIELNNKQDLSMAYTPGVGRISQAIADNPEAINTYTARSNTVAVISNGTAVLGLGNVGPEAAMPVMEGKSALFKSFAGVNAYPLCVNAQTAEEILAIAKAIEPTFGGINLEDIAAPVCFDAEELIEKELDIPVFHDDQHGTAIVAVAALLNAGKVLGKDIADMKCVMLGAGAAGVAITKLLVGMGIGDVLVLDRNGIISQNREYSHSSKQWLAEHTNKNNIDGNVEVALDNADVFMGVSGPNLVEPSALKAMADDAIVFAMANPVPEVMPELVPDNVKIIATGRSDYPNQINNVLVFPGIFKGIFEAGAKSITQEIKLAATYALANVIPESELNENYIIPNAFDEKVVPAIVKAVKDNC
jgi:malate dehydrogenase (oxaloacetate-decarboxylating)